MPVTYFRGLAVAAGLATLLSACGQSEAPTQDASAAAAAAAEVPFEDELRLKLETAEPGDVITVPEGVHEFSRSLTLNTDGVTIRGAGMDKSVLSFKGQLAGAEGLLVNASDFTIEDLAIEDTVGDALKVNEGSNIVIRRVRTEWTNGPATENGAYGIYPVQTENVLIDESVAIGASDAGIYVGQSRTVVVRNSRAEFNVAGIEIENTINADVYGNVATNNTGGILVFNMPDLPRPGHSTRVFDNDIVANNTENFGAEGTPVASVPAGSGVVINSNDRVEIFGNRIADNETANIIISSYFATGYQGDREMAESYDPYPETIYIHGNEFAGGGSSPDGLDLKALKVAMFGFNGRFPDILWDGWVNPDKADADGNLLPEYAICVNNDGAEVLNVDLENGSDNVVVGSAIHDCSHDRLAAVELSEPLETGS